MARKLLDAVGQSAAFPRLTIIIIIIIMIIIIIIIIIIVMILIIEIIKMINIAYHIAAIPL